MVSWFRWLFEGLLVDRLDEALEAAEEAGDTWQADYLRSERKHRIELRYLFAAAVVAIWANQGLMIALVVLARREGG